MPSLTGHSLEGHAANSFSLRGNQNDNSNVTDGDISLTTVAFDVNVIDYASKISYFDFKSFQATFSISSKEQRHRWICRHLHRLLSIKLNQVAFEHVGNST